MKRPVRRKSRLKDESGMALMETIPILVIFLMLIAYGLGFFGVVHTGILNSIASRAYAFETFRNRSNVTYFRDKGSAATTHYANIGARIHTVNSEKMAGDTVDEGQFATTRNLALGREVANSGTTEAQHNERIDAIERRNRRGGLEASPAWIMVGYGICINSRCGDQ
jgi:Flp pilus assembly protein TadG